MVSSPPKAEIDKPVDWALGRVIWRDDKSKPLFSSYRLTNQYQEKHGHERFSFTILKRNALSS